MFFDHMSLCPLALILIIWVAYLAVGELLYASESLTLLGVAFTLDTESPLLIRMGSPPPTALLAWGWPSNTTPHTHNNDYNLDAHPL